MYTVKNKVEGKIVGNFKSDGEFIDFMNTILKDNGDENFSIIGVSDAEEYLQDFCEDLELIEPLSYAVILNFESGKVEVLSLDNKPEELDSDEFIELPTEEGGLGYDLSNCNYMVTEDITMYNLNF